jgi:hypothetical protein
VRLSGYTSLELLTGGETDRAMARAWSSSDIVRSSKRDVYFNDIPIGHAGSEMEARQVLATFVTSLFHRGLGNSKRADERAADAMAVFDLIFRPSVLTSTATAYKFEAAVRVSFAELATGKSVW